MATSTDELRNELSWHLEDLVRASEARLFGPSCDTCDDTGVIRLEYAGAPGTGGYLTCPDCQPTPPIPVEGPLS